MSRSTLPMWVHFRLCRLLTSWRCDATGLVYAEGSLWGTPPLGDTMSSLEDSMAGSDFTTISLPWTVVFANSTSARAHPASGWMSASLFSKVKGDFEICERISDLEISLGYQTANVENSPDSAASIGSYQTSNGVYYGSTWTDISTYTDAKAIFRFVWMTKNTAGSSLTLARVGGSIKGIKKS